MQMRWRILASTTLAMSLIASGSVAAYAHEVNASTGDVQLFVRHDGKPTRIDASTMSAYTFDLTEPAVDSPASSRLIGWDQWFGCFSLNHRDDVFSSYTHYWDGVGHDIRLKCGEGDAYSGWGYKHIRAKHEGDWQSKLDAARQRGWNSASQGVESWDDLMAGAIGEVTWWPDVKQGNAAAQTTCAISELMFVNTRTGEIVYSFYARVGWANNNDRVITAFPQSTLRC